MYTLDANKAKGVDNLMKGTRFFFYNPIDILFDSGITHSFISQIIVEWR